MQQHARISQEEREVQCLHSEVVGKSVLGEFRETIKGPNNWEVLGKVDAVAVAGSCRSPSPQAALCAEASASAAGKAGRSHRQRQAVRGMVPRMGWGWTRMCIPAGAGLRRVGLGKRLRKGSKETISVPQRKKRAGRERWSKAVLSQVKLHIHEAQGTDCGQSSESGVCDEGHSLSSRV